MLRLRQRSFETNDRIKNLFNYLRLDTDQLDYGLMFDRMFLGEETRIEKLWAGRVNIREKNFKIVRTKPDIFKTDISSIIIRGEERINGGKKQIAVTFGVSWKQTLFFVLIATGLMSLARSYFPSFFNLGTLLIILGIQATLILIELKKTADLFDEYLSYLAPTNQVFIVSNEKSSTMRRNIILGLLLLALASCTKEGIKNANLPDGTYTGTFLRSTPNGRYAPSNVTMTFTKGMFSGNSDALNYPSICTGTYQVVGQEIEFTNQCFFTANFDWSFVINNKFTLVVNGKNVTMSKKSATETDVYDTYTLTLQ